jgi:hypothetical protein
MSVRIAQRVRLSHTKMHAECGGWYRGQDLPGFDLLAVGKPIQSDELCLKKCQETENCNAVVHKTLTSRECWLKNYPEKMSLSLLVENPDSDSMSLCPDQTLAGIRKRREKAVIKTKTGIAVVSAGAGLAFMITALLSAIMVRGKKTAEKQAAAGGPKGPSGKAPHAFNKGNLEAWVAPWSAQPNASNGRDATSQVRCIALMTARGGMGKRQRKGKRD